MLVCSAVAKSTITNGRQAVYNKTREKVIKAVEMKYY